jgi:hypothetical protein
MKVFKWVAIGVGSVMGLAGATVALVFALTAGAAGAADAFLAQVGQGRYEEAYRATAPQFQAQTTLDTFRATMQRFSLDKYESASWNSREVSGARAQLEGTVMTRDGGRVLATVTLVKVDGAWKIYGMQMKSAGAS